MLIDTHAHLFWDTFREDFDQVIDSALQADVSTIINIGVDSKTSETAAKLKSDKVTFYSTLGIHPEESPKFYSHTDVSIHENIEQLARIYRETLPSPSGERHENISKVIMVGECGLDFLFLPQYMLSPDGTTLSKDLLKDIQIKLFQAQIDLAKKLNLPLSVHCRDDRSENPQNSEAWDFVLKMVGDHPAILHCYSGLIQATKKILPSPNLLVSFAATLTYPKNNYLVEAVKLLPLERLVLETDSPFLPPQGKRGQRNEPANIKEIAELVAEIKGFSLEKISNQTTENVKKFLKLPF